MNKTIIGGIIGVIVIGAIAIFVLNMLSDTSTGSTIQNNDPGNTISRPAVQAIPNTFSIMTPEEKAASEQAAREAAEAAALASTTATSGDDQTEEELEEETN